MEGHDVFTQRNEIGDDDPFAGSDFGDWEQEPTVGQEPTPIDPLAENGTSADAVPEPQVQVTDAPQPEPPTLDAPPPPPSPSQAQAAQEESSAPDVASAPPSPPSAASAPAPEAPPEPQSGVGTPPETGAVAAQEPPQQAATPADVVVEPLDPQEAAEEAARREQEGDVPIDTEGLPEVPEDVPEDPPPQAGESGTTTSSEPESSSPPPVTETPVATVDGDAPMPDETKDKRGRVTHRRYVILHADGNGKFTQLDWYEDKQRKLTTKGAANAKRQTVVLARGTEDALKFGYVVVGSPPDGAQLVAVAAAYFLVRNVSPKPPEPAKQRLHIS
jgi:hypothetical protein